MVVVVMGGSEAERQNHLHPSTVLTTPASDTPTAGQVRRAKQVHVQVGQRVKSLFQQGRKKREKCLTSPQVP